jgi:DNA replication protein DnaC
MLLYQGTSDEFVSETTKNAIVDKLEGSFKRQMGYNPSEPERRSWQNSLRAMALVVSVSGLKKHGVGIEYQLPGSSKRLDFMITGLSVDKKKEAVIIELKQWEKTEPGDGDKVVTFVGQRERDVLHPSVQVGNYRQYLSDQLVALHEGETSIRLSACSYLHNYSLEKDDPLLEEKFKAVVQKNPVFSKDDVDKLVTYLNNFVPQSDNGEVLEEIVKSKAKPSKKLLEEIHRVVKDDSRYVLLDEQIVAYNRIVAEVKRSAKTGEKAAVIIRGGPGTGKSVIALNVMGELSKLGHNTHYVTGSKAFTETVRQILGKRGAQQVKYFNSYMTAESAEVDVMICDEAHRIRITSNNRFTKKDKRSNKTQLEELFDASKVAVFFIDDRQVVRPDEIGSSVLIKEFAQSRGIRLYECDLTAQFRCNGSDAFINWVNHTLQIDVTANPFWEASNPYEFKVFNSPIELENAIHAKVKEGSTARMSAGFCWKWSDPDSTGNLLDDVVVGDWRRPWDAKPGAGRLAKGIPPAALWAYDPNGIGQVGCVYTAQGFEFDYIGVIIGKDLIYRSDKGWVGVKEESYDTMVKRSKDKFVDLVKNTYRVLLTRGMKGCYVYFMDEETRKFFESRITK